MKRVSRANRPVHARLGIPRSRNTVAALDRYPEAVPPASRPLDEIRDAIAQLRAAATHDHDAPRGEVADRLARRFEGIDGPADVCAAARGALRLYRGGMGSFSDTGTAVMDAAVERLRRALERAV